MATLRPHRRYPARELHDEPWTMRFFHQRRCFIRRCRLRYRLWFPDPFELDAAFTEKDS